LGDVDCTALAAVEKVRSAFGFEFVLANLRANVKHLLDPLAFPMGVGLRTALYEMLLKNLDGKTR
jgi:hypothetical protein